MDGPPLLPTITLSVLVWLGLWACVGFWGVVGARWWRGQPILPVAPRRQVPWRAVDLALVVGVYIGCLVAAEGLGYLVLGPELMQPLPIQDAGELSTTHYVIQLLDEEGGLATVVLCVVSAVLVAPVVEEILFRLFLQGWMEALDRRLGPQMPTLRRLCRWGTLPVLLGAALFARMHFHVAGAPPRPEALRFAAVSQVVASLVTVVFAVSWVRAFRGATAADLGLVRRRLAGDVGLGLAVFGGVAMPVYVGQFYLHAMLAGTVSPDPITLFPFAIVLGVLYCRTHRIVPSMVLHLALNGSSLLLFWVTSGS